MNLPGAPIAHEGFFGLHFFTVSDLDKSREFYVRVLGGKVIKPDNPSYCAPNFLLHSNRSLYNRALLESSLFGRTSLPEPIVILIRN
jgi:catechol 2,3-dioxygenase-like lactoylglutathione lyase family enzyme